MDLGLKGRKSLVTGGTKGIGRAIANELAAEGADVAICARTEADVEAAVAALSETGVRVSGRTLDVGDGPAVRQWVDDVAEEFGGLDIVVPNVSALAATPALESWQQEFNVDLMHTVHTVEAAMPHLEKSDAGSIVVISSVSGIEIDFAAGPLRRFQGGR